MHAPPVFILMLNIHWIDMRTFVLVVDLVHLILEELIVVAFLVIDQADDQQHCLHYYALDRTVVGRSVVAVLEVDAADAQSDQCCSGCEEVGDGEVVQRLEDQGGVEFAEEKAQAHEAGVDDPDDLEGKDSAECDQHFVNGEVGFIGLLPCLKLLLRTDGLEEVAEEDEIEGYLTEEEDEAEGLSHQILRALESVGQSQDHRTDFHQTHEGN